jgi:hypothetical membrane protein
MYFKAFAQEDEHYLKSGTNAADKWLIWLGGLCGIVQPVLTLIMVLSATVISPWFRWDTNALSELGVGEVSLLFNSAALLGGVLIFFFALGLHEYLESKRLAKAGSVLIMLGSVCLALVSALTITYLTAHVIVSLGFFVLLPLGFILIGFSNEDNVTRRFSLVSGVAALIAILVLPIIIFVFQLKIGFAVPEITEVLIIAVWIIFMGAKLLKH